MKDMFDDHGECISFDNLVAKSVSRYYIGKWYGLLSAFRHYLNQN